MTQEELKRLAKIAPEAFEMRRVLAGEHRLHWRDGAMTGLNESYDDRMVASIVSSLLAPWTAVRMGDEYVLTRFKDMGGPNEHYPVWYSEKVGDIGYMGATRFQSPLHAAEALHQEKQP